MVTAALGSVFSAIRGDRILVEGDGLTVSTVC